ncbi:MAG: restriction endonuclease subunit S [Candidatus Delongbacteria bacterium]|nr:restriction endonuclease subunit S [Candidatus Delongbacteria bacterium]
MIKPTDKNTQKIPQLRFTGFTGEWVEKRLGDVIEFLPTNSLSREKLNWVQGKIKNIHYGDIHTKYSSILNVQEVAMPFLNEDVGVDKFQPENYCKDGDLVIADASEDYADIGKTIELTNVRNDKIVAGLHTFLGREKQKFSIRFKSYLINNPKTKEKIKKIAQGISVLSISKTNLREMELIFPTLPEQQKIANFLSDIDTKIDKLSRKKELMTEYKKGVMQKIFSKKIRFKDEKGNDYPDWQEKRLGEVCTFFSGGTPTSTNKKYYNGDIPFIKSGEINATRTEQFINEEAIKNSSAKIVEIGDILYVLYGATSGCIGISKIKGAINQAVLCIRTKESKYFIKEYLEFRKQDILSTYLQGGQGNLSAQIVKKLKFSLPCLEEQKKIAEFLTNLDKKIEIIDTKLEAVKVFKKGLLQGMFV